MIEQTQEYFEEFYDPDRRPVEEVSALPPRPGLPKLTQMSKWSCLPTSFAMVLAKPEPKRAMALLHNIMTILGRDDERGFHVQELLYIALSFKVAFIPFHFEPELDRAPCPARCHDGREAIWYRGEEYTIECKVCEGTGLAKKAPLVLPNMVVLTSKADGVLTGMRKGTSKPHAVAWCSETLSCLDPEEGVYPLTDFVPETFWLAKRC